MYIINLHIDTVHVLPPPFSLSHTHTHSLSRSFSLSLSLSLSHTHTLTLPFFLSLSPQLLTRLQADEALIKSLTDQVNELTSSETLSRVRESYSSAMAQSNHQHQQEVVQLQEQLEQLREEMERKVNETCPHLCILMVLASSLGQT